MDALSGYGNKKSDIPKDVILAIYAAIHESYRSANCMIFATDGSVSNEYTGIGVLNASGNYTIKLKINQRLASLTAELLAIRAAIKTATILRFNKFLSLLIANRH